MSTQFPDIFAALAAPFERDEVKVRTQAGRQLHYITARTAMNRLDAVLGGENWWDDYFPQENSVLCRLTIRLPDGSTVTKADAGGYAGMADQGDDDKSGYSDAFKRAAVKFGVGRYLYRDGVVAYEGEAIAAPAPHHPESQRAQQRPQQPAGAANGHQGDRRPPERQQPQGGHDGPPRTGRALFAWTKEMEQKHDVGLLKFLNGWAKLQEFPGRMVDWDADQVQQAHAEAIRKLQAVGVTPNGREPGEEG